ncbi:MAG TPA: hypothetical protein VGB53_00255, partial [Rubricoccaceae bacterium]
RGVRLAPFTVEHADYLFNDLYADALQRGDTALAARTGAAFLTHLDAALDFAEGLSVETFGREVPQTLLLHANALNAAYLGATLDRLAARGYRFVTLEEAAADPAYGSPDGYTERFGVSWLHRWRAGRGLPSRLRDEPDPPAWILEALDARGQ